jgi:hypothetical protein
MKRKIKYLLIPIVLVFLILPLGLLAQNPAWGEWGLEYFKKLLGFVPEGIEKNKELIKPILPDYSVTEKHPILSYYISALIGVLLIFAIFVGFKVFIKNER